MTLVPVASHSEFDVNRPIGSVSYDNRGRVILVSGGASGIGRAVCEAFLASGASVACLYVDQSSAFDLPREILFIAGDVSIEVDCQRAVENTLERFDALDVLVNNAAIQPPASYKPLDQVDSADWQRMVGINLSGYHYLAKQAVRPMLQQRSGIIINIASGQAHRTARQVPCYGPLKAANLMQTMQWGVEYARDGVRVVSISPGAINTPLVRVSLAAQGGAEQLANRHPLGRIPRRTELQVPTVDPGAVVCEPAFALGFTGGAAHTAQGLHHDDVEDLSVRLQRSLSALQRVELAAVPGNQRQCGNNRQSSAHPDREDACRRPKDAAAGLVPPLRAPQLVAVPADHLVEFVGHRATSMARS